MNKKLLAAAVGATLVAAPVFSAQAAKVKVYGKALVEAVNVDSSTGATVSDAAGRGDSQIQQGDRNGRSRWGMKATQDLGNGMKAIANFEFKLDPSNNDDETNRQQWVGLQGGFGKVYFGRDHSAYKRTGGVKWDPYTASFLQARRSGGMSGDSMGHNGFRNDLIGYQTPKGLGGFSADVQFVVEEQGGSDGEYHIGAKYKTGALELIAKANHNENNDTDAVAVGARYKTGGFTGFIQFEDTEHGGSIRPNGTRIVRQLGDGEFLLVGAGYKFGNNLLHGNVGNFDSNTTGGTDVDYFALGLTHFFDKKTRVFVGFANSDVDKVDDVDMFGAGIRFDF